MSARFSFVALALVAACSSSEPAKTSVSPVSQEELLFASTEYDLAPGDEKYLCWAGNLPDDRDVHVRGVSGDYGQGTHHIFFAWTLAPEPDGMSECPVLFKTTWIPIYLGGKGTTPLELPKGSAIDLGRGKQLVLQLHLQNTTASPIRDKVTMHLELSSDETFTPAGIFGLDDHDIALPPGSSGVHSSMSCTPGKDMNVFSVLGHMHKLGKELLLTKNGAELYREPWNFDEQPIVPLVANITKNDVIGLDCAHDNPTNHLVSYGESSDTEMCAAVFYYTPFDALAGCVKGPPIADAGAPPADGGGYRVVGSGACANDADLALVGSSKVSSALSSCGASCIGQATSCAGGCVAKDSGLSSQCAACFGDSVMCIIQNCLTDCAAAPDGAACASCRAAQCDAAFTTCSGLGQ